MKLETDIGLGGLIILVVTFNLAIAAGDPAKSDWRKLLETEKIKQAMTTAVAAEVPISKISDLAVELNYPACDILEAEIGAGIDAYIALKTIITAGGDVEHLARCCAEPKIAITSAVFAKAAIDAGLSPNDVDRLIGTAFTPQPGEPGVFKREAIIAGGEIREGIVSEVRP